MKDVMVGADFTLAAMCDDFVELILNSLDQVDFSHVLRETDDVSTTVRGQAVHVFDVTKALCLYAAQSGQHFSFNIKYSAGCQGSEKDREILKVSDQPVNQSPDSNQYVAAKFSIYPVDLSLIQSEIKSMEGYAKVSAVPLATKLEGELSAIFDGLEKTFSNMLASGQANQFMVVSISINSPSHDERKK